MTSRRVLHRALAAVAVAVVTVTTTFVTAEPAAAATYAYSAQWVSGPLGQTLVIQPSGVAQSLGTIATDGTWNNALDEAGRPPYSSEVYSSLYKQLKCHLFYKFRTPFHLDTWRPDVSWTTELITACNPLPGTTYGADGDA